jgi:hypothetical protein
MASNKTDVVPNKSIQLFDSKEHEENSFKDRNASRPVDKPKTRLETAVK